MDYKEGNGTNTLPLPFHSDMMPWKSCLKERRMEESEGGRQRKKKKKQTHTELMHEYLP